jgi:hypothetical protein
VTTEANFPFDDPGAVCIDSHDGAVQTIVSGDTVDTTRTGTYVVKYGAVDGAGNRAVPVTRTVVIRDTLKPVIALADPTTLGLVAHGVDGDGGDGGGGLRRYFHISDASDTATLHDGTQARNPAPDYFH